VGFGRQPVSITSARFGLSFNFWKSEPSAAAFQNEFRVSKDDFLLGNLLCQTQVNSLEASLLDGRHCRNPYIWAVAGNDCSGNQKVPDDGEVAQFQSPLNVRPDCWIVAD
jgi:hypothetical protein